MVAMNLILLFSSMIVVICAIKTKYHIVNPDYLSWRGCLSHHEAKRILKYKSENTDNSDNSCKITASIDLGYSTESVHVKKDGIYCTNDNMLASWSELETISDKENACYALFDDGSAPWHISVLSKSSGMPAFLCPPLKQSGGPTMVLGGFTMHRIVGDEMNPMIDTKKKLESIEVQKNSLVLDTCMGLGYTAIESAKFLKNGSGSVTTIEYDLASIEIAAHNPWSKKLFDKSLPINIIQGDSVKEIKSFSNSYFDVIIHDPPAIALCKTDLYSSAFYSDLYRVLKKNGQLFHYIGNPNSKESGRLYKGIMDRLMKVGFKDIVKVENAFGIIATKK